MKLLFEMNSKILKTLWLTSAAIVCKESVKAKNLKAEAVHPEQQDDKAQSSDTLQTTQSIKNDQKKSCIVVVGTTG